MVYLQFFSVTLQKKVLKVINMEDTLMYFNLKSGIIINKSNCFRIDNTCLNMRNIYQKSYIYTRISILNLYVLNICNIHSVIHNRKIYNCVYYKYSLRRI